MGDEWPAVRREARRWRTNPDQAGPHGLRPNHRDRALTEIEVEVPALIADRTPLLDAATLAECEAAVAAIVALEGRASHLAGLADLLIRSEAVASSRIERVDATLDDVARAVLGAAAGESAHRTVAAVRAMRTLTDSTDRDRPITESAVLDAHVALVGDDPTEAGYAGRYRDVQNWVGGSDMSPRDAVHIPPPADEVQPLMTDLLAFANRTDIGIVAQSAIVHGQFEAIHPFTDGNGRVGRGLLGSVLRRRGLTREATVPVAAVMLADVDAYFDHLRDYREGDPGTLVSYVARSAVVAAEAAGESADRLAALPDQWHRAVGGRAGSSARTLVDGLTAHPILDLARAQQVTRSSARRTYEAIDRLSDAGVLDEITGRGRNRIWVARDVLEELQELDERIGRRSTPGRRWR